MKPNKTKVKSKKKVRGFYTPRSYRFSGEVHKEFKEIAKKFGSQNLAMKELLKYYLLKNNDRNLDEQDRNQEYLNSL